MVCLSHKVEKNNKEGNKVLDKIDNLKSTLHVLNTRKAKNNYIHSLKSIESDLNPSIRIKMKEDYKEEFWWNIDFNKGKEYELEIVKYDLHEDWKLAITSITENNKHSTYQVKIFTDRFDILTDKKTIWNTWIIEWTTISLIKAVKDIEWMWGFITSTKGKGVAQFRNFRGEDMFLLKWDVVRVNNSYEDTTL